MTRARTKAPVAKMREKAGLTQAELAKVVGVSENTIANWEKGTASKWITHLNRLCNALNCSLQDLDPEDPPQPALPEGLSARMLDTTREYCVAIRDGHHKTAAKISSFATLHDKDLRYWLDHADQMIKQASQSQTGKINCESVVNALVLKNLLIQLGRKLPNQVDYEAFCSLIEQSKLSPEFLRQYASFSEDQFRRNLILQARHLTVYVIGWMPGQIVPIHHHGNSLDAIRVVEGEMSHWVLSPEECVEERILFEGCTSGKIYDGKPPQVYSAGDLVFIDRLHPHQIANRSTNDRLVTEHFRYGSPPDDENWEKEIFEDQILFAWSQEEPCYICMP